MRFSPYVILSSPFPSPRASQSRARRRAAAARWPSLARENPTVIRWCWGYAGVARAQVGANDATSEALWWLGHAWQRRAGAVAHDAGDGEASGLVPPQRRTRRAQVGRGRAATRRVRLGDAPSQAGHRHSHDGDHGRPVQGSGADAPVNQSYGYTNGKRGSIRELPQMPRADWFGWRQRGTCWPHAR